MDYTEDSLVEQPAIQLPSELGWENANCFEETFGPAVTLGRETSSEVVLLSRIVPNLECLNPNLPAQAFKYARGLLSCQYVVVSNGYWYVTFRRENDGFQKKPSAYLNLLKPKMRYPLDPENVDGGLEVLRQLLPNSD